MPPHDVTPQRIPVSAGLCRYCLREMWTNVSKIRGMLPAAPRRPGACDTCASWIDRHGGADPRDHPGNLAERLPAESAMPDPRVTRDPRRRCTTATFPAMAFDPPPDEDDPVDPEFLAEQVEQRERAARWLCAPCPVRDACRAAALACGLDGLWGGALFDGDEWRDLLTGETGPTIYAPPADVDEPVPA